MLNLENMALNHSAQSQAKNANLTISAPVASINRILLGVSTLDKEVAAGAAKVNGRKEALGELLSFFDAFDRWFNIVTP